MCSVIMQPLQVFIFTLILDRFMLICSATDQRIINGIDAEKPIPYQVGLLMNIGTSLDIKQCGGTIISKRAVLTAAHCVVDAVGVELSFASLKNSFLADSERQRIYLTLGHIFVHEDYDSTHALNDIAIIKLPVDLQFDEFIRPANLPKGDSTKDDFANRKALASGWGRTSSHFASDVLQQVTFDVISNEICQKLWPVLFTPSYLCVDTSKGLSTCLGDSGGPLVVLDDSYVTLIGIVSFGFPGCEPLKPAVFTRVSEYLPWIQKHLD